MLVPLYFLIAEPNKTGDHLFVFAVLQVNPSIIRQWLRSGDLEKLESVVLEGQGHKLVGEYSPDPKVRAYLKTIPALMVSTRMGWGKGSTRFQTSPTAEREKLASRSNRVYFSAIIRSINRTVDSIWLILSG